MQKKVDSDMGHFAEDVNGPDHWITLCSVCVCLEAISCFSDLKKEVRLC